MHRCYITPEFIDSWQHNPELAVPEVVLSRLVKILRLKKGELFALFDGQGRELQAFWSGINTRCLSGAQLIQVAQDSPQITLLQAALEESKISETIKRSTEFGVTKLIIFAADRSEPYVFSKLEKRHERLELLAIDAARQSGRYWVPEIVFADSLIAALKLAYNPAVIGLFGDIDAKQKLSQFLASAVSKNEFMIAVGPEGGWSIGERELLLNSASTERFRVKPGTTELEPSGYPVMHSVSWSPSTLRSELASLAAIAIINAHCGRA